MTECTGSGLFHNRDGTYTLLAYLPDGAVWRFHAVRKSEFRHMLNEAGLRVSHPDL